MKKSLDLLLSTRSKAGIAEENTFLFSRANVDSLQHLHGSDCLRQEAEECGAKHPEYIRSTKLRKQIATIAQVINLKDHGLDILVSFMGHDIRTHKEFYRIPEPALQAAKISKLLFGLERGMITSFAGKSLDKFTVTMEDSSLLCRNVCTIYSFHIPLCLCLYNSDFY